MSSRTIWERGIPLADADYRFAPPSSRNEYAAARARISENSARLLEPSVETKISAFQHMADAMAATATVRERMRSQLLTWLRSGELVAYGFEVPRHKADLPASVPRDLFQEHFVLKDSGLRGHGIEFAAVRVLDPLWVQEIEASAPKQLPGTAPRARGRRSVGALITHSVQSLIAERKIDPDAPNKLNADLVRARVHDQFPEDVIGNKGLSDETIRRVVVKELQRISITSLKSSK